MISDKQTNTVYLSVGVRHYGRVRGSLLAGLSEQGIDVRFIPRTVSRKHVWARDFMPIQLEKDKFLIYRYAPDYLNGYEDYIPPYREICKDLGLNCVCTDIVLDGGNVVKCGDKVIMTDKLLKENPGRSENDILSELEKHFNAQIVLVPWDRYERFGHADGMVRWIDGDRVLMNDYCDIDPAFGERLRMVLSEHFIVEELSYGTREHEKVAWAYINFLHVGKTIFVPGLGIPEDDIAREQISEFYHGYKVIRVEDCVGLVSYGGALNCATWNILSEANDSHSE